MSKRFLFLILIAVFLLAFAVLLLPPAVSALYLNLANAAVARATALPQDAPDRQAALAEADALVNRAQQFSRLDRLGLVQARAALARGDAAGAAVKLDQTGMAGRDPITEYVWGNAEWQANRQAQALEHWRAGGVLTLFMQEAHRALGAHEWQRASEMASIATAIAPDLAEAHYAFAEGMSHQLPVPPLVMQELDRAAGLTRDPELLSTILSRQAEMLVAEGKLQEALQIFAQARQVAPLDARPRTGYALVLLASQPPDRAQAVALLNQVIIDSPWYTDAYIALADLAASDGDSTGAETWLKKGIARNSNDAHLLFALGKLYARQGRPEQASATLVLALQNESHADNLLEINRYLAELKPQ